MATYSDEELLAAIERLASSYGRPPTLQEIRQETPYSGRVYFSHFGSWQAALETAGFEPRPPQTAATTDELIAALQRLGDQLGRAPTITEMNEDGEFWGSTYKNHFDSWAAAIKAAGYDPTEVGQQISNEKLRAELQRLGDDLGEAPTFRAMEADGKYDPTTYIRRFGSWNDALEVAGFDPRTGLTEDDLLADLRRLADDLGKQPSQREMNDHGEHSHTTYVREFGSWTTALNAAFDDEDD